MAFTRLFQSLRAATASLTAWGRHIANGPNTGHGNTADHSELLAQTFDAVPAAVALFDADDRLLLCNGDFRKLYAPLAAQLQAGARFETLLRSAVALGLVPESRGAEKAWIAARLAARSQPGEPFVRQLANGRWRRIVEERLPDGRLLAHSVDITELHLKQQALEAARQEGEAARQASALAHARLQDAIEALPAGFELYDANDRLLMTNSLMRSMYPLVADLAQEQPSFEEMLRALHARGGMPQLPDESALDAWLRARQADRHAASLAPVESPGVRQAGNRWIRSHERRTREGGVVGIRIDVTEIEEQRAEAVAARAAAEQASARLTDAIEALPEAFVLFDADDRVVLFNSRYPAMYAASGDQFCTGARFEDMLRVGLARGQFPQALGREEAWLQERLEQHLNPRGPIVQELPGNRWLRIDERRTRDGGIAGVRSDITELVRREQQLSALNQQLDSLNAELARLSDTDALTGLANRRRFDRQLAIELASSKNHGTPLALVLFDVDHFKHYNDLYGHPAGDACLQRVAEVLQACARPGDTVARWGGEEFALLLPQTGADPARQRAQACLEALDALQLPHEGSPLAAHVTMSGGLALHEEARFDTPHGLLQAADAALYRAKLAGRHQVAV